MSKALNPSAMYESEVKAAYKTGYKAKRTEKREIKASLYDVAPLAIIAYMLGGL